MPESSLTVGIGGPEARREPAAGVARLVRGYFRSANTQSTRAISSWDSSAQPNLLLENYPSATAFAAAGLTHSVLPPYDLTFRLLQDIGW